MNNDNMREYSIPFAAWELRLYLDTHPDDAAALAKYKALCAAAGDKCNYACHVANTDNVQSHRSIRTPTSRGGCSCGCGESEAAGGVWSWIDGPWPWEVEANNVGGNC